MDLSRRDLMKLTIAGGVAVALPTQRALAGSAVLANRMATSALPPPFTMPFRVPNVIAPVRWDDTSDYYRVSMQPVNAEVITGYQTPMWGYNGEIPGPTFKVRTGRAVVVRQVNNLPSQHPTLGYTPWTSVHLHGSASLPEYDGYASDISNPGQFKDYRYPNWQNARTLWYHDHGVHHTAENVFMGLAGMYQISDPIESGLQLPNGEYDVPLINSDGSLLFSSGDGAGFYGDVITVNGRAWPTMQVQRRKYRFRILNASPSRSYAWYLDNGAKMSVVGTDCGLMASTWAPTAANSVMSSV